MFFITTDTNISVKKLFLRIFSFSNLQQQTNNITVIKLNNLNVIFHNCKKVELPLHTVFISGNAFPDKLETLKSALEKSLQQGSGENFIHGNFNLIVFNKEPTKENFFSIISDRYGTIPCFFSQENSTIKISSVFHFFLLDKTDYNFNEQSLLDYLCLGYVSPGEISLEYNKNTAQRKVFKCISRYKSNNVKR